MNKVELIKKAKMPLRVISDIYRYAESGYDSIEPDDFTLFKWYGVYEQRPKGDGNFMMRIKVPGGNLTSVQMRELAAITKEYARGISDITTRQTFQLHWLRIEQFPDIFKRMDAVGITSSGACGDIARWRALRTMRSSMSGRQSRRSTSTFWTIPTSRTCRASTRSR
jgi:sulfite reductase beta subunit-like hemoprotein